MKIKKMFLILSTIMTMVFFAGCAQGSSASSIEQIKSKGKLVMGTSADYPPFEFYADIDGKNEVVGMDVSMAKEIAKDLGVELEIKDMDFDGLIAALASDNVDIVLAGMNATEERKQSVDFTNVYYTDTQKIVVRSEDMDKYKTLDDLKDAKIGAQKGTIQEELAVSLFPDCEQRALAKITDLVLDLKSKNVDAIVLGGPIAESYVANTDGISISEVSIDDPDMDGYAIAIKKGNTDLVEKINETIDKLKSDGSLDKFFVEANELYVE